MAVEEGNMSDRLQWIVHKGKRILVVKFAGIKEEKVYVEAFADLEREILRQPKGQFVPLVVDVSDTRVTRAVIDRAKQMMEKAKAKGIPDSPVALVGLAGAQKAIVSAMQLLRPDIHVASSPGEASEWIAKQLK